MCKLRTHSTVDMERVVCHLDCLLWWDKMSFTMATSNTGSQQWGLDDDTSRGKLWQKGASVGPRCSARRAQPCPGMQEQGGQCCNTVVNASEGRRKAGDVLLERRAQWPECSGNACLTHIYRACCFEEHLERLGLWGRRSFGKKIPGM